MEVRGRQPGEASQAHKNFDEARVRAARETRSNVREAREAREQTAQSAAGDRLELSATKEPSAEISPERMAELKQAADEGELNTPERIEKAAHRMLGDR